MALIYHLLKIKVYDPEEVYNALTTSEGVQSRWTTDAEAYPAIESHAVFRFSDSYQKTMRVVELLPDRRVLWECIEGHNQWLGTTIAFEIEPVAGGIDLRLYHAGWEEETDLYAHCNYHWALYLGSLKSYLETGKGKPHPVPALKEA